MANRALLCGALFAVLALFSGANALSIISPTPGQQISLGSYQITIIGSFDYPAAQANLTINLYLPGNGSNPMVSGTPYYGSNPTNYISFYMTNINRVGMLEAEVIINGVASARAAIGMVVPPVVLQPSSGGSSFSRSSSNSNVTITVTGYNFAVYEVDNHIMVTNSTGGMATCTCTSAPSYTYSSPSYMYFTCFGDAFTSADYLSVQVVIANVTSGAPIQIKAYGRGVRVTSPNIFPLSGSLNGQSSAYVYFSTGVASGEIALVTGTPTDPCANAPSASLTSTGSSVTISTPSTATTYYVCFCEAASCTSASSWTEQGPWTRINFVNPASLVTGIVTPYVTSLSTTQFNMTVTPGVIFDSEQQGYLYVGLSTTGACSSFSDSASSVTYLGNNGVATATSLYPSDAAGTTYTVCACIYAYQSSNNFYCYSTDFTAITNTLPTVTKIRAPSLSVPTAMNFVVGPATLTLGTYNNDNSFGTNVSALAVQLTLVTDYTSPYSLSSQTIQLPCVVTAANYNNLTCNVDFVAPGSVTYGVVFRSGIASNQDSSIATITNPTVTALNGSMTVTTAYTLPLSGPVVFELTYFPGSIISSGDRAIFAVDSNIDSRQIVPVVNGTVTWHGYVGGQPLYLYYCLAASSYCTRQPVSIANVATPANYIVAAEPTSYKQLNTGGLSASNITFTLTPGAWAGEGNNNGEQVGLVAFSMSTVDCSDVSMYYGDYVYAVPGSVNQVYTTYIPYSKGTYKVCYTACSGYYYDCGAFALQPFTITVRPPGPSFSSASPNMIGLGPATITITGSSFDQPAGIATFQAQLAPATGGSTIQLTITSQTIVSDSEAIISIVVPVPGMVSFYAALPNGAGDSGQYYNLVTATAPTIVSIFSDNGATTNGMPSPTNYQIGMGMQRVTISGMYFPSSSLYYHAPAEATVKMFLNGATTGGFDCVVISQDSMSITCTTFINGTGTLGVQINIPVLSVTGQIQTTNAAGNALQVVMPSFAGNNAGTSYFGVSDPFISFSATYAPSMPYNQNQALVAVSVGGKVTKCGPRTMIMGGTVYCELTGALPATGALSPIIYLAPGVQYPAVGAALIPVGQVQACNQITNTIASASMNPAGDAVVITFTRPMVMLTGGAVQEVACSSVVAGAQVSLFSRCGWISFNELGLQLDTSNKNTASWAALQTTGSSLVLNLVAQSGICSLKTPVLATVMANPYPNQLPTIAFKAPSQASTCSPVMLDVSASLAMPGSQRISSISWTCNSGCTAAGASAVGNFTGATLFIPPAWVATGASSITATVRIVGFYSVLSNNYIDSKTITVYYGSNNLQLDVIGPTTLSASATEPLFVSAAVALPPQGSTCATATNNAAIVVTWTLTNAYGATIETGNGLSVFFPAGTFTNTMSQGPVGYVLTFTATQTGSVQTTAMVMIMVAPQVAFATWSGPSAATITSTYPAANTQTPTLVASYVSDAAAPAPMLFEWSCFTGMFPTMNCPAPLMTAITNQNAMAKYSNSNAGLILPNNAGGQIPAGTYTIVASPVMVNDISMGWMSKEAISAYATVTVVNNAGTPASISVYEATGAKYVNPMESFTIVVSSDTPSVTLSLTQNMGPGKTAQVLKMTTTTYVLPGTTTVRTVGTYTFDPATFSYNAIVSLTATATPGSTSFLVSTATLVVETAGQLLLGSLTAGPATANSLSTYIALSASGFTDFGSSSATSGPFVYEYTQTLNGVTTLVAAYTSLSSIGVIAPYVTQKSTVTYTVTCRSAYGVTSNATSIPITIMPTTAAAANTFATNVINNINTYQTRNLATAPIVAYQLEQLAPILPAIGTNGPTYLNTGLTALQTAVNTAIATNQGVGIGWVSDAIASATNVSSIVTAQAARTAVSTVNSLLNIQTVLTFSSAQAPSVLNALGNSIAAFAYLNQSTLTGDINGAMMSVEQVGLQIAAASGYATQGATIGTSTAASGYNIATAALGTYGSAIAGSTVSITGMDGMTLPKAYTVGAANAQSTYGSVLTAYSFDPFTAAGNVSSLSSKVYTASLYKVMMNNTKLVSTVVPVAGVGSASDSNSMLAITIPTKLTFAQAQCRYFNPSTNTWVNTERNGLAAANMDGTLTCYSTHLTAFAIFYVPINPIVALLGLLALLILIPIGYGIYRWRKGKQVQHQKLGEVPMEYGGSHYARV